MVEMLIAVGAAVRAVDLFSYQFGGETKKTENMCNLTSTRFCRTHYTLDAMLSHSQYINK